MHVPTELYNVGPKSEIKSLEYENELITLYVQEKLYKLGTKCYN